MKGLLLKATGSWYTVRCDNGQHIECRLPGKFRLSDEHLIHPVAVGDRVRISEQNDGTGVIEHIEERKNKLLRKATHGRIGTQLIAANVDQALIVQSLKKPSFKTGFIDRILVCCEAYNITPLIVMNKIDLQASEKDVENVEYLKNLYMGLGYRFFVTSIYNDVSIKNLQQFLEGTISVMTGHSGTGKTSLLNVLYPGLNLKTKEVSRFSNKGKHSTTYARLIELSNDTGIIDTPGIREFGLVDIESYELSLFFPEMRSYREACRFYNCTHQHEPYCAVRKAVDDNLIAASRYRSYINILEST